MQLVLKYVPNTTKDKLRGVVAWPLCGMIRYASKCDLSEGGASMRAIQTRMPLLIWYRMVYLLTVAPFYE